MLRCKECDIEFVDKEEAQEHVVDEHADACDRHLEEYIPDSVNDAYADLIEGEE